MTSEEYTQQKLIGYLIKDTLSAARSIACLQTQAKNIAKTALEQNKESRAAKALKIAEAAEMLNLQMLDFATGTGELLEAEK